jgi:hypothetical protein
MAASEAKAAAEAAAAILKDNSKASDIFISGVNGVNFVINGLYSPTQETGQDGRVLYRKISECGDQALCIEHFEGRWCVKNQSDRGSVACFAHVEGCCALEGCRSRIWKVSDGEDFVDQPSAKLVTGDEAKSQASGRVALAPRRPSCHVFDADELCRARPPLKPRPLLKPLLLLFIRTNQSLAPWSSEASVASTP